MPVVSFSFDKILVEKKKPLETPLSVENGMKIVDLKEETIPLGPGDSEKVIRFYYDYSVEYKPNQASIVLSGNLVFHDPQEKLEEIMKEWKKSKKLPPSYMQSVMNNVLIRCQVKALALGQDVGLPPHIRIPTVTARGGEEQAPAEKNKAEEYIG